MKTTNAIKPLALLAIALAVSPTWAGPTVMEISKEQMAAQWPFTVERGVLGCERGAHIKFVVGKKTYGLNGSGMAYSQQMGFGWHPVREIWRDDPANPGTKLGIGPMIQKGQTLCKPW